MLIGGWLEGKYTGIRYVHANGEVKAKVWYTQEEKVELKQVKIERTGTEENKYSVSINNFRINFYKTLSKLKNYDTIEEIKKIKLFSDFYLPIEIIKTTNYEQVEKAVEYTLDEAKQIAIEKAMHKLDEQIENKENITSTSIYFSFSL